MVARAICKEETRVSNMMIKNGVLVFSVCYAISANWSSGAPIDYAMGMALLFAFDLFQTALTMREKLRKWESQAKSPL